MQEYLNFKSHFNLIVATHTPDKWKWMYNELLIKDRFTHLYSHLWVTANDSIRNWIITQQLPSNQYRHQLRETSSNSKVIDNSRKFKKQSRLSESAVILKSDVYKVHEKNKKHKSLESLENWICWPVNLSSKSQSK